MSIASKYKNLPVAVKASLWYLLANILVNGISFFTVPIFSRVLSMEYYGRFTLYTSWVSFITIFSTLNLFMGVYPKGLIKFSQFKEKYVGAMQMLTALITVVVMLAFIIGRNLFEKILGLPIDILILMLFQILMVSGINFWSTRLRFEYKYVAFVIASVIMGIGTPIVNLLAVYFLPKNQDTVIYSLAVYQISVGAIFFLRNLRGASFKGIAEYWKFALKMNIPLVPFYLSQIALDQLDRIMISHYLGEASVALYNIPYQLSMAMTIITSAISNSFVPTLYDNMKKGTERKMRKYQNVILIIIGVGCLVLCIMAPELLRILAPPKYAHAVYVIPPVIIGAYLKYNINIINNIEFYYEKPRLSMYAAMCAAALNFILNVLFIPTFGYVSAGYTTMVSFLFSLLLHVLFIKKLKYDSAIDIRSLLLITTIVSIMVLSIQVLYTMPILRYSIILLLILVLAINYRKFLPVVSMLKKL